MFVLLTTVYRLGRDRQVLVGSRAGVPWPRDPRTVPGSGRRRTAARIRPRNAQPRDRRHMPGTVMCRTGAFSSVAVAIFIKSDSTSFTHKTSDLR